MQSVEFKDGVLTAPISQVHLGHEETNVGVISVTCDKEGNVVGDTSQLPENIRQQLETPEAKEMMRKQYKKQRNNADPQPNRELKYVNNGGQVNYQHMKPAGMSSKEFRQLRRRVFRDNRKAALKITSSIARG